MDTVGACLATGTHCLLHLTTSHVVVVEFNTIKISSRKAHAKHAKRVPMQITMVVLVALPVVKGKSCTSPLKIMVNVATVRQESTGPMGRHALIVHRTPMPLRRAAGSAQNVQWGDTALVAIIQIGLVKTLLVHCVSRASSSTSKVRGSASTVHLAHSAVK